ncbi:MAG: diphthine synthase, partial [Hadesarchaea archaeon]|nr:diphthine synthase [Hadesarchaea archaeon]
MLIFVGLGLQSNGLSIRGLESLEDADSIYAELYTSLIPDSSLSNLSDEIGEEIKVLDRERIEDDPSEVLESASKGKTILLVPGDPMIATTHIDLRLRAEKAGIETKIIHGASIETAAPGLVGL